MHDIAVRGRALLAPAVSLAALVGLADRTTHDLTAAGARSADGALVALCEVALTACALWALGVSTVVAVEVLCGRPRLEGLGVPTGMRRLLLAACGLAAAGSVVAAGAASATTAHTPAGHGSQRPAASATIAGLPLPGRPLGGVAGGGPGDGAPERTVRPGDSLWALAEQALAEHRRPCDDAAVAAYWPRVYAANRAVVGADPDLILPGQRLVLPDPTGDRPDAHPWSTS